jgi:hypothetical protein
MSARISTICAAVSSAANRLGSAGGSTCSAAGTLLDPVEQFAAVGRVVLGLGRRGHGVEHQRLGHEQRLHLLARRIGHGHQAMDDIARAGFHVGDLDPDRAAADRRAKREEMAAFEVADLFGLTALHAQKIGGAGHVDVEESAPHQEVGGFGSDVLGQLGQALGGDDPGQPALAPTAHEVRHRREREAAHVVGHVAGGGRRKHLRFVDDHQRGIPLVARGVEQGVHEDGGAAHLRFEFEPVEREDHRGAMLADARGQLDDLGPVIGRSIDDDMAKGFSQADEIAFRVDHHLLDDAGALFEDPAQKVRLSRAAVALHQKARGQQFLDVDADGGARPVVGANDDGCAHAPALNAQSPRGKAGRAKAWAKDCRKGPARGLPPPFGRPVRAGCPCAARNLIAPAAPERHWQADQKAPRHAGTKKILALFRVIAIFEARIPKITCPKAGSRTTLIL